MNNFHALTRDVFINNGNMQSYNAMERKVRQWLFRLCFARLYSLTIRERSLVVVQQSRDGSGTLIDWHRALHGTLFLPPGIVEYTVRDYIQQLQEVVEALTALRIFNLNSRIKLYIHVERLMWLQWCAGALGYLLWLGKEIETVGWLKRMITASGL